MPNGNNFLLPTVIGKQALANLYATNLMAGLVHRDYSDEFVGKVGDTVTIRKPPRFVATEYVRSNGITIQDAAESGIPVVLNHFADVSFEVTSEQASLQLKDFNEQLLNPAMEALVQKIDSDILTLRNDVVHEVGQISGEQWSNPRGLIAAQRVLNQNLVPTGLRSAVVGPVTAAEWLKDDLLNRADARGNTEGRLEASLGARLFGLDPYMTNHITVPAQTTGASQTEVGVAFHKTAFALVTRPLSLPMGATNAAYVSYGGFGLRVIMSWSMERKADVVSIDCLYGVKTIDANRAVLLKGANVA